MFSPPPARSMRVRHAVWGTRPSILAHQKITTPCGEKRRSSQQTRHSPDMAGTDPGGGAVHIPAERATTPSPPRGQPAPLWRCLHRSLSLLHVKLFKAEMNSIFPAGPPNPGPDSDASPRAGVRAVRFSCWRRSTRLNPRRTVLVPTEQLRVSATCSVDVTRTRST